MEGWEGSLRGLGAYFLTDWGSNYLRTATAEVAPKADWVPRVGERVRVKEGGRFGQEGVVEGAATELGVVHVRVRLEKLVVVFHLCALEPADQPPWQPKVGDRVRVHGCNKDWDGLVGTVKSIRPMGAVMVHKFNGPIRADGVTAVGFAANKLEPADQPYLVPVRRGGPWASGGRYWERWWEGAKEGFAGRACRYRAHNGKLQHEWDAGGEWGYVKDGHADAKPGLELRAPKGYNGPCPEGSRFVD